MSMKNISAKELETNLDAVLSSAQSGRIMISRGGKPCAVLVGVEDYDAEDLRLASSQDFWHMIQQRRTGGKSFPLAEVEARLQDLGRKQVGTRATRNTRRKPS